MMMKNSVVFFPCLSFFLHIVLDLASVCRFSLVFIWLFIHFSDLLDVKRACADSLPSDPSMAFPLPFSILDGNKHWVMGGMMGSPLFDLTVLRVSCGKLEALACRWKPLENATTLEQHVSVGRPCRAFGHTLPCGFEGWWEL